jgi:hypothetical protein
MFRPAMPEKTVGDVPHVSITPPLVPQVRNRIDIANAGIAQLDISGHTPPAQERGLCDSVPG